ncbi:unnamed protein product, partial [Vitis vinifera]
MDMLPLAHHLFVLVFLIFLFKTVDAQLSNFEDSDEPLRICKYERFSEVKRECSSFLSSASELKLEKEKAYEIATELSFVNGDWVQEAGGAPLMPFDDSDMPRNFSSPGSLLKLASFWMMGIDFSRQLENAINICGYLSIAITRNSTLSNRPESWTPLFFKRPGVSELRIPFEGLYMESEENEGERLMCLLGTSIPPFSEGSSDPLKSSMPYRSRCNDQFSLLMDDRIMLVLRFPKRYTLTNRAIYGEMRSLNENSNPNYFDRVHMSSQLGFNSKYLFGSEMVVSKARDLYPDQHELIDNGVKFEALQFCKLFRMFDGETFDIVENSRCDGKGENCNNLDPFVLESEVKAINGIPPKFRLMMNNLHCVSGDNFNEPKTAKASAVFRAFSSENRFTAGGRTGLSGMTISAEGTWNSSSGQFCMIGCVGFTETGSHGCNSQICLYFPATFSITQRSIIFGTISSLQKGDSHNPLWFRKVLRRLDLWNSYNDYSNSYLSYKYSKIDPASILLKRNEKFNLGTIMKKSFMKYPSVEDINNITSVSLLSDKLGFGAYALPDPLPSNHPPKTYVGLEVLSLGSLFGRYWPDWSDSYQTAEAKLLNNSHTTKQNQNRLLNVSASLTLTGESYGHISMLFLEGLYNPLDGKIFFIGCRDVPVFQESIINNPSLDSRMDCLIEVTVDQRNEEDPLSFRPIILKTDLIPYRDNSKEIIIRRNFEAVLRILVLLASTACTISQLFYIQKKADVIPFISLTMYGVQALGFGLPLFTGAAVLFKWKEFEHPMKRSYARKTMWFQVLDSITKSLSLVAFVLSLRLFQKIWKARLRLPANKPLNVNQNPSDKPVFLSSWTIHTVGFLALLIIHNKKTEDGDFFLLPQIIGNIIWKAQVKPLRKVYYIGFTALRLLLRAYDYVRDPVIGFYIHQSDFNQSSEFFSKSEGIVIMAILVVLAITVGVQQRWNFNKPNNQIMNLSIHAWTVCGLLMVLFFSCSNSSLYGEEFDLRNEPSVTYKYDRIDEVKKACGFVLSSASELKPDDNRVYSIKKELPFVNGDWVQDAGGLPLMPYVVRKSWDNSSDFHTPMNLVSFWVTDVDTTRRLKNSVSVSGLLTLGITLENSFVEKIYGPQFQVWPGTTMLPSREPESSDPWAWLEASGHSYDQLPLSEDDQILLVLRYPKKFTLTKREVHGEMKSLNPKSNPKYFDEIRISSQLNTAYEFSSEKVVAKACDPYPYKDSFMNNGIEIYKDTEFCAIIQKFSQGEAFTIVPNWRCNGTDEYCSKLGPFVTDKEIKATDGGFQEVKLFMQNVHCEEKTARDNTNSARVSAVFRAVPPSEYPYTAAQRSGLSNMTLPAEGIWRSSSGQLCMVGCIGSTDAEGSGCNSRICLYIPVSFSVKQRSIIVGTISSISNDHSSYFPLSFEKLVQPSEMWDLNHFMSSHLHYQHRQSVFLFCQKISHSMSLLFLIHPLGLQQRENILSRRGVEGILRILTLSVVIACIVSQLLYIRDNVDSVPYISLVMLGVQVLGYSLPLITDAEALFKKASDSYGTPSYELDRNQWFHVIDYTVKLLVLVSFLLTLRLCQKVWKSRIRLLTRAPLESHRVPSDKWVFITTLIIHVIGYIIVLIIHAAQTELEEYVGLVQDFFLLPQVMGNFVWQIHCKPLRKLYFIGITVVRLLPHFYDYIRAPVSNPYFSEEYEFVNPNMDFYSKFGDIAIPVTAFFLAVIVYIQQRWNYEKLSQILTLGKRRLLPLGSAVYQRLPSKSFEAELASGVNENATHEKDHDDGSVLCLLQFPEIGNRNKDMN